jgi:hypothetical protein
MHQTRRRQLATLHHAVAALYDPGCLEIGEPDLAARIAEYGTSYEQWPCDEWDWTRHLLAQQLDGNWKDIGPQSR